MPSKRLISCLMTYTGSKKKIAKYIPCKLISKESRGYYITDKIDCNLKFVMRQGRSLNNDKWVNSSGRYNNYICTLYWNT